MTQFKIKTFRSIRHIGSLSKKDSFVDTDIGFTHVCVDLVKTIQTNNE